MNQKTIQRVLHLITALGFAWGVAAYVHRYDLLEFAYAPGLSSVFVFVGYLFLSRRYDPSLSVIFLVVAVFVFYQAVTLSEKKAVAEPFEKVAAQKLSVLASLVEEHRIRTGRLPNDLNKWIMQNGQDIFYCVRKDCDPELTKENPGLYFIGMRDMLERGDPDFWYIDDAFHVFSKK